MTDFSSICKILGELYSNHKEDVVFQNFIEYNDLGLPLAYMVTEGLATPSKRGIKYITETWKMFLDNFGIQDTGYTSLNNVLGL